MVSPGDDAEMICTIDANPIKADTVQWTRQEVFLPCSLYRETGEPTEPADTSVFFGSCQFRLWSIAMKSVTKDMS